jgi:metallo-beta-lactamase family protein
MAWVKGLTAAPKALYLVHGESESKKDFAADVLAETGMSPIVIDRICEMDLAAFAMTAAPPPAVLDPDDTEKLLCKIRTVNENLGDLLYDAKLAVNGAAEEEAGARIAAIQNIIVSLEKDTMQLAHELSGKRTNEKQ